MRILVINTQAPFVQGGAEFHADNLVAALREAGHAADLVKIPFTWSDPKRLLDQILAVRLLDVTESYHQPIDLVIGLKFPAYLVRHPNKVLWILHQHKMAYEHWQEPGPADPDPRLRSLVRESILRADNRFIPEARRIFANSATVAKRLQQNNRIDAEVLYHPPPGHERIYAGDPGDYIFYPSRLTEAKRQHLALEAFARVKGNVRLVLAGFSEGEGYEARLRKLIESHDLQDRVQLLGAITEQRKLELYAHARGVLYLPRDEDYGYVTLEAFLAGKPVITCSDSGGPLEFVRHGENGWICPPEPAELAAAIEELAGDCEMAMGYGKRGHDYLKSLDLSWNKVVEALIS